MVVFNIRDLEEDLRPVAMYIVHSYIWNKVRSDKAKRMLIIDEAWQLLQFEDSAKFMFSIAKRARKYYLGLTTISQDVEDMLSSKMGRAIVNNSSLQILLKQSPAAVDAVAGTFRQIAQVFDRAVFLHYQDAFDAFAFGAPQCTVTRLRAENGVVVRVHVRNVVLPGRQAVLKAWHIRRGDELQVQH